jgi:hypothetical protein
MPVARKVWQPILVVMPAAPALGQGGWSALQCARDGHDLRTRGSWPKLVVPEALEKYGGQGRD